MTLPTALLEHEQVVVGHDAASGLRAIVAIHSTALGPALGGTRFVAYADLDAALDDALALARAMTYKNALAGLPHGGGKAVIIADPKRAERESLVRAHGRAALHAEIDVSAGRGRNRHRDPDAARWRGNIPADESR